MKKPILVTKYDIIVHNIDKNDKKINSFNTGYRWNIQEVLDAVKHTLECPEIYGRVFINGKVVIHPMVIEITEIPNAKSYAPHSLHLDKDHKEKSKNE